MRKWLSGIRGLALLTGLWVVGWGLGFGGIMEAFIDPDGKIGDIWPTMLALPGLIGGIVFSLLIALAEPGNSFERVSLVRFVLWGALAGAALGALSIPAEVGDVSPGAAGMIGIATALGIVSGLGSGLFCRLVARFQKSTITA